MMCIEYTLSINLNVRFLHKFSVYRVCQLWQSWGVKLHPASLLVATVVGSGAQHSSSAHKSELDNDLHSRSARGPWSSHECC